MKTIAALLTLTLSITALAGGDFFENSPRRDATETEGRGILRMNIAQAGGTQTWCSAFFVRNSKKRPLIATARHCVQFDMASACKMNRLSFVSQANGYSGLCKRVVAESKELDMTLIEADFGTAWVETMLPAIEFYSLSSQRPRVGTRLVMLGYPVDPYRRGAFTVSDNCWVSNNPAVQFTDLNAADQDLTKRYSDAAVKNPLSDLIRHGSAAFNNCSVYGGNSGGPILKEGTKIVLGLPTRYWPGAYGTQNSQRTEAMDSTVDFIEANKTILRAAGILTAKPY